MMKAEVDPYGRTRAGSVRAMRRTVPFIVIASLAIVACSGSDSAEPAADSVASEQTVVAEGDTSAENDEVAADAEVPPPSEASADKPTDIDVPGVDVETLKVTVLTDGDGPIAEAGDTVIVDYIGVRALDGVEFDNSYDRGAPFAVGPLGQAQVIQGWNDGLLGAQTGARLQLDIPSDQAYGEAARSDVIRENEPLTFVIDVRSVIKAPDASAAPTEMGVEPSEGATDLSFEDLIEGDGAVLEEGQTAVFNLVLFRADSGVQLDSTWTSEPIQIPMAEGQFAAIVQGMPGMKVGGRRAITFPPALGFGESGNPQIGLPVGVDAVLIVDLFGAY
jgi:FKBP-type peptidyl-prolyl cis-trans isomerase